LLFFFAKKPNGFKFSRLDHTRLKVLTSIAFIAQRHLAERGVKERIRWTGGNQGA